MLPETLPEERRRAFDLRRANPVGALRVVRRDTVVFALFGGLAIYFVAHDVNPTTWTYYVVHRFAWSPLEVGLALGVVGMSSAVVSGTLVGRWWRASERHGRSTSGLRATRSATSVTPSRPRAGRCFLSSRSAFAGIVRPSLRGVLSRRFAAEARGEMEGAIASLISLVAIASPLILTQTFHYFSSEAAPIYFPGASFFLAGILALGALTCFARVLAHNPELIPSGDATTLLEET